MRQTIICCAAAMLLNVAATCEGQDAADLARMRDQYIRSFKRIGLNTAPEDAMFLRIMIESTGAKRGIEVGTATGYGAMSMGLAFEKNSGHLTTIDIDPEMVKIARKHLANMKLDKTVTVVLGDALKVLPKLEGQYDFLFIDAAKKDYLKYLKAIEPRLKSGCVIVADNAIRFADAMRDFLDYVRNSPNYHSVIIRASLIKRDGMMLIYKIK